MGDLEQSPGTGWTVLKVLGLIVGLLGMVGFGLCSVGGLAVGLTSIFSSGSGGLLFMVLIFAVPGLGIASACFLLVREMISSARKPPS